MGEEEDKKPITWKGWSHYSPPEKIIAIMLGIILGLLFAVAVSLLILMIVAVWDMIQGGMDL